jgi:hypothetical protein
MFVKEKIDNFTQFFRCNVGLSGAIDTSWIGQNSNSYAVSSVFYYIDGCRLDGEYHRFELPEGATRPEEKDYGNVYGCGLVLDPDNKLAIFFTLNGNLFGELVLEFLGYLYLPYSFLFERNNNWPNNKFAGRKIPISPAVDRLFPAVTMTPGVSIEANFGDNPAKPFEYDIKNCPGLELACI